jgi:predicted transcriptional regulator
MEGTVLAAYCTVPYGQVMTYTIIQCIPKLEMSFGTSSTGIATSYITKHEIYLRVTFKSMSMTLENISNRNTRTPRFESALSAKKLIVQTGRLLTSVLGFNVLHSQNQVAG